MALVSMAVNDLGQEAVSFTGSQSGIVTDTSHTKAKILEVKADRIKDELSRGRVVIVAGFQGVSKDREVTTLGRGGSDTTAVALAAASRRRNARFYTDVDGVYTSDPRLVPGARKIPRLSYDEMLELASLGAKVLHNRSVEIARRFNVPIHVRSSFNWNEGSRVVKGSSMEQVIIRGIGTTPMWPRWPRRRAGPSGTVRPPEIFQAVGDAADDDLFHGAPFHHTGPFVPVEAGPHVDRNVEAARRSRPSGCAAPWRPGTPAPASRHRRAGESCGPRHEPGVRCINPSTSV